MSILPESSFSTNSEAMTGAQLMGEAPDLTLPVRFYYRPVYQKHESEKKEDRSINKRSLLRLFMLEEIPRIERLGIRIKSASVRSIRCF